MSIALEIIPLGHIFLLDSVRPALHSVLDTIRYKNPLKKSQDSSKEDHTGKSSCWRLSVYQLSGKTKENWSLHFPSPFTETQNPTLVRVLFGFICWSGWGGWVWFWWTALLSPHPSLALAHSDIYLEKSGHSGIFWHEVAGTFHGWEEAMAGAISSGDGFFRDPRSLPEIWPYTLRSAYENLLWRTNLTWVLFDGACQATLLLK